MANCYFTINSNKNFFESGDRWDPLENEVGEKKRGIKQYHNKFIGFFRWLFGNAYWIRNKTTKTSIFIVKNSWKKWKERNRPQENYTIHTFVHEIKERLSKPKTVIPVPPSIKPPVVAPEEPPILKKFKAWAINNPLIDIEEVKKSVWEVCNRLFNQVDDFINFGMDANTLKLIDLQDQIHQLKNLDSIEGEPFNSWLQDIQTKDEELEKFSEDHSSNRILDQLEEHKQNIFWKNLQSRILSFPTFLKKHLRNLKISKLAKEDQAILETFRKYVFPAQAPDLFPHLNEIVEAVLECIHLSKSWYGNEISPTQLDELKETLKTLKIDVNLTHPALNELEHALQSQTIDQETYDAFITSHKYTTIGIIFQSFSKLDYEKAITLDKDGIEASFDEEYKLIQQNLKQLNTAKVRENIRKLQEQQKALDQLPQLSKQLINKEIESPIHDWNFTSIRKISIVLPYLEAWIKDHPKILTVDLVQAKSIIDNTVKTIEHRIASEEQKGDNAFIPRLKELKAFIENTEYDQLRHIRENTIVIGDNLIPTFINHRKNHFENFYIICESAFSGIFYDLLKRYYTILLSKACEDLPKKINKTILSKRIQQEVADEVKVLDKVVKTVYALYGSLPKIPDIFEKINLCRQISDPIVLRQTLIPDDAQELPNYPDLDPSVAVIKQRIYIWEIFNNKTLPRELDRAYREREDALQPKFWNLKIPEGYNQENFVQEVQEFQKTVDDLSKELKAFTSAAKTLKRDLHPDFKKHLNPCNIWLKERKPVIDFIAANLGLNITLDSLKKEVEGYAALIKAPFQPQTEDLQNRLIEFYGLQMNYFKGLIQLDRIISLLPQFEKRLPVPPVLLNEFPQTQPLSIEHTIVEEIRVKRLLSALKAANINFEILRIKQELLKPEANINFATLNTLRNHIFNDSGEYESALKKLKGTITKSLERWKKAYPTKTVLLEKLTMAFNREIGQFLNCSFNQTHETIPLLSEIRKHIHEQELRELNLDMHEWENLPFFEKMGAKGILFKINMFEALDKLVET